MDNMTFANYRFEPSDVIEGLNRYFAEAKAKRYLRAPLKIKECRYGYILCDPEEVVGVAINWLREEHDIFYTPGMITTQYRPEKITWDDVESIQDVFCEENLFGTLRTELVEARRMHHKDVEERNQFGRRLMDIRKAAGMADGDPTDLVKYVEALREKAGENGVLREERDNLKDNLRITENVLKAVKKERDQLKERCGKLEERLRTYRFIANGTYGDSCGYSKYTGDKAPAFLCDVISYSWNFGSIAPCSLRDEPSYSIRNDSIRVELDLTPTANYKGTFDMEDLKRYIQNYGREKKLGILESVDYQNAKVARAELANLYKTVLGKEKLDRDLSPHEVMKAILDEYMRVRDSQCEFLRVLSCSLGFGNPVVKPDNIDQKEKDILERVEKLKGGVWPCENSSTFAEYLRNEFPKFCKKYNVVPLTNASIHDWLKYIFDVLAEYRGMHDTEWARARAEKLIKDKRALEDSLAELRAKVREIYRSVVDDEWDEHLSYTSALNDINEEYKRVVHSFEERTADWSKAQQEYSRYRLAVGSLLDIPKESRDDINAIERSFEFSKKKYKSLQEFRDNVCEILDIPSSMADNQILKEIHDVVGRYDELEDFRADICGALDIDEMIGSPRQNDKYILEQVEKLKDDGTSLDRYARFRSNICTALCLGGETSDEDILKRVHMTRDCHDKLCKDYTELRKAIWDAMGRKPETLPDETARLVGEVRMLQLNYAGLKQMHDEVAKAIGMDYPVTDNDIINRVKSLYDANESNHDVISDLNRQVIELRDKNADLESKFRFHSGLRQQWHERYESEHERANGVQKALDREREKCRVKDISLETAKKQYEKVCSNLETAECALNGMKSKVRELREEKTKVISALGQDIWDDCLK